MPVHDQISGDESVFVVPVHDQMVINSVVAEHKSCEMQGLSIFDSI